MRHTIFYDVLDMRYENYSIVLQYRTITSVGLNVVLSFIFLFCTHASISFIVTCSQPTAHLDENAVAAAAAVVFLNNVHDLRQGCVFQQHDENLHCCMVMQQ